MEKKNVQDLELHEITWVKTFWSVMRVPGGLIYSHNYGTAEIMTFVPFDSFTLTSDK